MKPFEMQALRTIAYYQDRAGDAYALARQEFDKSLRESIYWQQRAASLSGTARYHMGLEEPSHD